MKPSVMLLLFLLLLSANRSRGIRLLLEEEDSLNSKHYHIHEDSLRSHDVSKERKNGVSVDSKQEQVHVHSSAAPPPETEPRQNYPDTLDIAGMDYSPAKKMPPIHN
ncbi:uncharacterized protein LOC122003634 [Zingiber officinale]|uniref:uncharacterized protein LOC122001214 n=1 Tax=Zingiber officinale TaxID=94328 RepID=UPI001C4AE2DC|nr:uncharacterized protein LOC122001214 [Zingiber officinale]XP_042414647.1 uncharacterized protein LOC122003634 [Zingiber officinale]